MLVLTFRALHLLKCTGPPLGFLLEFVASGLLGWSVLKILRDNTGVCRCATYIGRLAVNICLVATENNIILSDGI